MYSPVQNMLEKRMGLIKSEIIGHLEKKISHTITYDSISPSFFRTIDIQNLVILRHGTGEALLAIKRLRVNYDLLSVLIGKASVSIREIIFENASVKIDSEKDGDFISVLRKNFGSTPAEDGPGSYPVRIIGRNLNIEVISGEEKLIAERVFFQLKPEDQGYDLRLRGVLSYSTEKQNTPLRRGGTVIEARSLIGYALDRAEATVEFSRLSTNLFDVKKQTFQINFDQTVVQARKIQDSAPFDLSFSFFPADKKLNLEVISFRLKPSSIITLKGNLSYLNEWLNSVLTVKGEIDIDGNSRDFSYSFQFDGSFKNSVIPDPTTASGKIVGDGNNIVFSPLRAANRFGKGEFTGNFSFTSLLPEGTLRFSDIIYFSPVPLSGEVVLVPRDGTISISGKRVAWGENIFYSPRVHLDFSGTSFFADGDTSFDSQNESSLALYFSLPKNGPRKFIFGGRSNNIPSEKIASLVQTLMPGTELYPALEDLRLLIDGSFYGTTDMKSLTLDIPSLEIRDALKETNRIALSLKFDGDKFTIHHWMARWGDYFGSGKLQGEVLSDRRFLIDSDLSVLDIPYQFSALIDPAGQVSIKGQYGVSAEIFRKKSGLIYGDIRLDKFPLPKVNGNIEISGILHVNYESPEVWKVEADHLEISDLRILPHLNSNLAISGFLGPRDGTLNAIQYVDRFSSLSGSGEFVYTLRPFTFRASGDVSENIKKNEKYDFLIETDSTGFSGKVSFQDAPIPRFYPGNISGGLSGSLEWSGIPGNPDIKATVSLKNGSIDNSPIEGYLSGTLRDRLVRINLLEGRYKSIKISESRGSLDFNTGIIDFATIMDTPLPDKTVSWNVDLSFNHAGPLDFGALAGLVSNDFSGNLRVATRDSSIPPLYRGWTFGLRKEGPAIHFLGGPGSSVEGFIHSNGSFAVNIKEPLPISFEASGSYREAFLEANVNRISFKIEDFSSLLDIKFFTLLRGRGMGNLRISGPPKDPDFFGTLSLVQGQGSIAISPDEIGPFRGNLIFREKEFVLQPVTVPVGRGTVEVSGTFQIDRWIPRSIYLLVDTKTSPGIRINYNFGGVIVNGTGQGKVTIELDSQGVKVAGNLQVSNTIITLGALQTAQTDPATKVPVSIDLKIESGRAVEFYWPTVDFPILQSFANLGQRIAIKLDGDTSEFSIIGDIQIRGGQVYYLDRSFYLREGTIRFNERNDSFDPILNARAEIRENTANGLVRIYLVADNTRFSQFSPRFESDGGLTNPEIFAILGRSSFVGSEDSINLSSALLFTGDILTQIGVVRAFEKEMRDRLGLDLFSVRTHVFQNILQGVLIPEQEMTERYEPSFGRYLDKTSVFLGKYIGSDLFLELLLQFRAEDPLTREIREFGGMNIDSELILEWKTPFFLLEWSFSPKSPEELFIFDNKLTFRWKFSF
jgi:hypothetical protein